MYKIKTKQPVFEGLMVAKAFKNKDTFRQMEVLVDNYEQGKINDDELFSKIGIKNASEEQKTNILKKFQSCQSLTRVINNIEKGERNQVNTSLLKLFNNTLKDKNYSVSDTSDIRVVDVSHTYTDITPKYTPFYNTLPMETSRISSDFRFKWWVRDNYTALDNAFFDPDTGPNISNKNRTAKYNTIAFIGDGELSGIIAEDITKNMGYPSNMDVALNSSITYLRKVQNKFMLSNTEDYNSSILKNNGALEMITTNVVTSITDFNQTNLDDDVVKLVFNKYGAQDFVLAVKTIRQANIIDTLRNSRTGARGVADLQFENLTKEFAEFNVPVVTVFESFYAGKIPVIVIDDLPATNALLYVPSSIQPVTLNLPSFGTNGPFVLMSMLDNGWAEVMQVFKTFSVEIANEKLNVKITGLTD